MEKKDQVSQNIDREWVSPCDKDIESMFAAWSLKQVIQIVLDDGREVAQSIPGFPDYFGTAMLHIVPYCIGADIWLGGFSPISEDIKEKGYYGRAVGRKEYTFCAPFDKYGNHRTYEHYGQVPIDSRSELMMRFACLQYLTKMSVVSDEQELRKERTRCLAKNGYSTHRGAISFYVYHQGVNLMHISLGFAGVLDDHDNWDDAREYECTRKVAQNLWAYLEQTVEQHCELNYPQGFGFDALCTMEGAKKKFEDL